MLCCMLLVSKIMQGSWVGAGGFAALPLVIQRPASKATENHTDQVSDYHRSEVEQTKF